MHPIPIHEESVETIQASQGLYAAFDGVRRQIERFQRRDLALSEHTKRGQAHERSG
jgi:hypothetical protein